MHRLSGMRDAIIHTAEGVLAGALGTKLMDFQMGLAGKIPDPVKPVQPSEHPGQFIARKVDERIGGRLSEQQVERAAHGLHWAYGIGWGALLGLLSSRLGFRSFGRALAAGAGLGAIVWLVGYAGWLPATGLTPPVHRQGIGHASSSLLGHLGYGLATALPLWGMQELERKIR